ncbi:hypothetical protein ACH5RR_025719 [Cinchona calisaya]|uniref:SBP-type domain-containing protein n=1 Tax=Cinchona calisaya TaxID=153742 RepID=A0ABD2Z4G3_9GENT
MESWSYVCGDKTFVSDESVVSGSDGISRGKNGLICSGQEGIMKNQEFGELGSANMMKSSLADGSIGDVLSSKFGLGRVYIPFPAPPNSVSGEEELSSKASSSIVESNSRDSSLIDLKLGRFPDHKDAQIKASFSISQAESSVPVKKARAGNFSSQRPFCQVHGCRKDLSSSKDYYKRHKVCEIHSKTAKVIVNGVEQRFCQQCSRFHLLAEFDDGKRSCRKRLAGHNERRRKPHIGLHAGRAGRFFQPYNGTRLEGTSFALSSFVCQDILPGSLLHPPKYEMNDWYRNVKVEGGAVYGPELVIPNSKDQTHPKSHMSSFNSEKQSPTFYDNGLDAMTSSTTNEKNNTFLHNVATSDFDSRSLFQNTTLGTEELTVLDSSSTVQGLPAVSNSGCALSLLSSQSQNSSNHSSGIPTAVPLITPSSHAHYSMTQVSEKFMRVSPQTSTTGASNTFHSSGINSAEETHMEPILIPDNVDSVNYGISGIIHSSPYMNAKNHLSCEDGSTIDLLQLSSQLQRVEHQRQSMQVKEKNDDFFGLRIT